MVGVDVNIRVTKELTADFTYNTTSRRGKPTRCR